MRTIKNLTVHILSESQKQQIHGAGFPISLKNPKDEEFDPNSGWIGSGPGGLEINPFEN